MWITNNYNWKLKTTRMRILGIKGPLYPSPSSSLQFLSPTPLNHHSNIILSFHPHILISSFWRPGLRAACSAPVPVCARQPASDQATTGFQVTFFLLTPPLTLLASLLSSRTGWIAINTAAKAIRPEGPIIWRLPSIILLPFFLPSPSRITSQSAT